MSNVKVIGKLNEILRGERAAAETYVNVLGKIGDEPQSKQVRVLKSEHLETVNEISDTVQSLGGTPDKTSGAWGVFAKMYSSASNILGDTAAINALKQGEEHGLKLYRELLDECGDHRVARNLASTHIEKQRNYVSIISKIEDLI